MSPLSRRDGKPVISRVEVRWGDCDPWGVALYPSYFSWLEVGAQAVARAIGLSGREAFVPSLTALRVGRVEAELVAPARLYDVLDVRTWAEPGEDSSITLQHEVVHAASGRLLLRAKERRLLMRRDAADAGVAHPLALSAEMRATLERPGWPEE